MLKKFRVGDRVACRVPGSWVDGRAGTITALDTLGSDGIRGHGLKIDGPRGGYTVVPECELEFATAAVPVDCGSAASEGK